ncbi:MAG: phosphatase PAP2 family protein [Saprospiraceae bacterium]
MIQIIKDNKFYFSGFLLFLLVATIILLTTDTGAVIVYFSKHRSPVGDLFFKYFTKLGEEWAYISCLAFFLLRRIREGLLILVVVAFVFTLSFSLKAIFLQDRPHTFFSKQLKTKSNIYQLKKLDDLNFIEGVVAHTGQTSFPSGHTLSGFALFGLVALMIRKKRGLALLWLSVAILVGLSRIYLVQHFLRDIYLGSIIGTLLAFLVYYVQGRFPYQADRWYDQPIHKLRKSPQPKQV